jgi:DNA-binding beta-propeller fold protein YncE
MTESRANKTVRWAARRQWLALVVSLFMTAPAALADTRANANKPPQSESRLRYPISIALAERGTALLAANSRSGTVSMVNLKNGHVLAEVPVGKTLSDLVPVGGPRDGHFLVTDSAANRLYLLSCRGLELRIVDSIPVSPFPASVCCDASGKHCFVASLWSRRVTFVDLETGPNKSVQLKASRTIPLRFAPRLQTLSPDGKILVVADAFGGNLAVIDVAKSTITDVKTIPGHNIRGLAWSADGRRLLVSHQTLNRLAYSTSEDIHWGSVVSNGLRSLDRQALENRSEDVLKHSYLFQLGDVGNGAGDPASLAVTKDGTVYIALAGVGEVAAGRLEKGDFQRLPVGIRPTALTTSADGSEVYVADTFGDTVAAIKANDFRPPADGKHIRRISLGPQPALSSAERGERLFFDAHLANENWMSCHSCHSDGHSSDQLSDTLGDGSFGAPKRIPSLGGVAETGPWAWNGSMRDLGDQVQKSLLTTMHSKAISPEQIRDLTEYLKTLGSDPPSQAPANPVEQAAVDRGRAVFARQACGRCHVPPTYTSPKIYDVGLKDEMDNHRFNPPSLRGVGQRVALFHDGRAKSLNEVFQIYRHPGHTDLPTEDVVDLVAFLRSL